jgi:hypothetical protein
MSAWESSSTKKAGPAEDHAAGLAAHAGRAGLPQEAQKSRDDLREHVAPQADLRLLLEQGGAEDALEGSHQAARIVREMSPHRLAAIGDAVILEAEEHRRRDRLMNVTVDWRWPQLEEAPGRRLAARRWSQRATAPLDQIIARAIAG